MIQPLIHIGYHKTGSSWLQRELFGRTDRGFHPLAPDCDQGELDPRSFARRFLWISPFDFDPAALREEAEALTNQPHSGRLVISHERLSGNPHSGGYDSREIADRLHQVFPNALILIVLREQSSMILSSYRQYLKVGGACSLTDYLSKGDGIRPSFSPAHFCYHRLIGHYQELFGRANTLALPYELLRRDPPQFIAKIARFTGAKIPADLPFGADHNTSGGIFTETKMRWLNIFACRNSLNGFSPLAPERVRAPLFNTKRRLDRIVPKSLEEACKQRLSALIDGLTEGYYNESNRFTSDAISVDLSQYGYVTAEEAEKTCVD